MLDEAPFAGVFPYVNKSCHKVIRKFETDVIESVSTKTKVFHNPEWKPQ